MAHKLTWHTGPTRMRRSTQGHVAEPLEPTRHLDGARWRERVAGAMRVHADAREGHHVASEGLACEGPMG